MAESCGYNRGRQDNSLYIVNHFITNPVANAFLAETINYDLLLRRARACADLQNRTVNFLTVDFWSASDLMAAVEMLNRDAAVAAAGKPSCSENRSRCMSSVL